jgi:hypothetical protein
MKLKTLIHAGSALALLGAMAACDQGLTDANENPNAPEVVPVENVLASGIRDAVSSSGYSAFGEWSMLYHTELWAQHVAQSAYNTEDSYTPRPGVNSLIWQSEYSNSLEDLLYVKQIADEQQRPNLWAAAEIMSVYDFLFLTDIFGDIPYFEALKLDEDIQNPVYTPQSEIYPDLLKRLKEAAAKIDPSETSADFATGDLIYDGDMQQWLEFANSLQLRIAMRMADTDKSTEAAQAFQEAWNADRFDDIDDDADLDWEGEQPAVAPLYNQIVLGGRTGDFRVSASLVDRLEALDDPRLAFYADTAADGTYRGLENGTEPSDYEFNGEPGGASDFSTIGSYFLQADLPSVLMSYSEMLFLGAEAAQRGWISGDAETLYKAAITASMQEYGIPQSEINAYLAQPEVAYNGLQSIGLQKWISLYMAGPEAFNEFRRTGYPALDLSENALLTTFPARLPYPSEESLYNAKNVPTVDITTPLWWMPQ